MKYILSFLLMAVLLLSCSKDNNSPSGTPDKPLCIYLLEDNSITAADAEKLSIESLIMASDPIITVSDIESYNWTDHTFALKPAAKVRVGELIGSPVSISVFGKPFVVVAHEERIYLGAFWPVHSSVLSPVPYINITLLDHFEQMPDMEIQWYGNDADPRNDQRIYQVLATAGVLSQ